jgi:hypothetical protein
MQNDGQGNIIVPSIKINGTLVGPPSSGGGDFFITTPSTNNIPNNIGITQGSVFIKNGSLSIENGGINIATSGKTLTVNGNITSSSFNCTGNSTIGGGLTVNNSSITVGTPYPFNTGSDIQSVSAYNMKCKKVVIYGCSSNIDDGITANGNCVYFPMYVQVGTGAMQASDYRLKDDIRDINELTTLFLRPVQYILKKTNDLAIGLIAHELQEQIPILVHGEKDGEEMQSVNYTGLIPVLIKDIQRLNQKIIDLEYYNSNLESRISQLENSTTR